MSLWIREACCVAHAYLAAAADAYTLAADPQEIRRPRKMTYRDAVKAAEQGIVEMAVALLRRCTPLPGDPSFQPDAVASVVRPHVEGLMIFLFAAAAARVAEKNQAQRAMILAIAQANTMFRSSRSSGFRIRFVAKHRLKLYSEVFIAVPGEAGF